MHLLIFLLLFSLFICLIVVFLSKMKIQPQLFHVLQFLYYFTVVRLHSFIGYKIKFKHYFCGEEKKLVAISNSINQAYTNTHTPHDVPKEN